MIDISDEEFEENTIRFEYLKNSAKYCVLDNWLSILITANRWLNTKSIIIHLVSKGLVEDNSKIVTQSQGKDRY